MAECLICTKGPKGDIGPTGATGATGPRGPAGTGIARFDPYLADVSTASNPGHFGIYLRNDSNRTLFIDASGNIVDRGLIWF